MTTDTIPKACSESVELDGQTVTVTGMAKGSGMIRPDMATMLAYIMTDADISPDLLDDMLQQAVSASFNRISVDGDTSTNDACLLAATGKSGCVINDPDSDKRARFQSVLDKLCLQLAQAIVRDGEGASKFVSIEVNSGSSEEECLQVAWTVAHSPLVKTALFASDPNWGQYTCRHWSGRTE